MTFLKGKNVSQNIKNKIGTSNRNSNQQKSIFHSRQYKLKIIAKNDIWSAYALHVPTHIADKYQNSYFTLTEKDGVLTYESGTKR